MIFLVDYLPASVTIKPAIGMFYIYFEGKIILIFSHLFCIWPMKHLNSTG